MKKIAISLVIVFSILLSSCASDRGFNFFNVKWTCQEPYIELIVKSEKEVLNNNGCNYGYIMLGEERIEIFALWTNGIGLDVFYADKFDRTGNGLSADQLAFRGHYYLKKGVLVLTITYDTVFNNKYEKLTFTMSNL